MPMRPFQSPEIIYLLKPVIGSTRYLHFLFIYLFLQFLADT